jgi:hypothetical protein
MPAEYDNHESREIPPLRQPWQSPEVEVLMVDQTENSSVQDSDGILFAS